MPYCGTSESCRENGEARVVDVAGGSCSAAKHLCLQQQQWPADASAFQHSTACGHQDGYGKSDFNGIPDSDTNPDGGAERNCDASSASNCDSAAFDADAFSDLPITGRARRSSFIDSLNIKSAIL